MKSKYLFFSLLSLFLVGCSQSTSISVITYNIRYDNPDDGENSWDQGNRKEKVFTMLSKHHPDIFGVQEALLHQVQDIEKYFHRQNYHYIGVGRDDGKEAGEYTAIFYDADKFKVLDSGYFWLSETPEIPSLGWDATCCHRLTTWVHFQDDEQDFFVFNTHLDHEGKIAQTESAKLILKKIKEIAKNNPVILMGDFNITDDNPTIIDIRNHGFTDGYVQFQKQKHLPKGTFNDFNTEEPLKDKIDYIFISKGIQFKNYMIDDQRMNDLYPSDHLPIWASVEIQNENK